MRLTNIPIPPGSGVLFLVPQAAGNPNRLRTRLFVHAVSSRRFAAVSADCYAVWCIAWSLDVKKGPRAQQGQHRTCMLDGTDVGT